MKKYILGTVFATVLLLGTGVAPVQALGLTSSQVQSILSVLSSFGADSTTITSVGTALNGNTTTTIQTPLRSDFLKNDQTAKSIMSGQIAQYDIRILPILSPFDTTIFAYRFVSALRMLGYTASYMQGNTAEAFLNNFEKANGYTKSPFITKGILSAVDSKLVQVEIRDRALANSFPLYKYYMNAPTNEPPKEHAVALFSAAFKNLPSSIVTWSEQGFLGYLSSQLPHRVNWQKMADNPESVCDQTMYQEIGDDCKPLTGDYSRRVAGYPSDFEDAYTLLHEYGHYIDGNIFTKASGVSLGIIDTTGFYGISYNVSDIKIDGWKFYTFKNPTNIKNELVSAYAQGWQDLPNYPDYYTATEDFAESFALYVTGGKTFRALATTNPILKQKYDWLKLNVFNGTEYSTGVDNALTIIKYNPNHVFQSTVGTGVFNINEFSLAVPGFVWDFNFPIGTVTPSIPSPTNGSCSATHYSCTTGNSTLGTENSSSYSWFCFGLNGGVSVSCSEAKSVPIILTPTASFSASPTTVVSGSSATLKWSSTNATSCAISGPPPASLPSWSMYGNTSGSGSTGPLTSTITYNLKCTGASGTATASVTITVTPKQTASALNAVEGLIQQPQTNLQYDWNTNLQIGSNSADVNALQTALTNEGVYAGEITGGFYNQTFGAVKAFQQKYGIKITGFVGPMTREKLNSLY